MECGVYRADMSWFVVQVIGAETIPHFHLYDSFEGFSPAYSAAADFADNPAFMDFANTVYRADRLYQGVRARFAGYRNITVIKGFLPEALAQASPQTIAAIVISISTRLAPRSVCSTRFSTGSYPAA